MRKCSQRLQRQDQPLGGAHGPGWSVWSPGRQPPTGQAGGTGGRGQPHLSPVPSRPCLKHRASCPWTNVPAPAPARAYSSRPTGRAERKEGFAGLAAAEGRGAGGGARCAPEALRDGDPGCVHPQRPTHR